MKRILFISILSMLLFVLNGQIQLESSYSYSGSIEEIDTDEFKYYFMDVTGKQCLLYNEDHTFYKAIDIFVPSGYFVHDIKFLSRRTFNDNDDIELLYIYSKTETVNSVEVIRYGLKVVDESGNILLNLADGGFAQIKRGSEGVRKLYAYQYVWNESYYLVTTNIYSIGSSSSSLKSVSHENLLLYPNPVSEQLKFDLREFSELKDAEISISNIEGKTLMRQPLATIDSQGINVRTLIPGVYILNVISGNRIFSAETFEKQ